MNGTMLRLTVQMRRQPLLIEIGIHVFKQNSRMEDIQFTNPNKNRRKLDHGVDDFHSPLLIKHTKGG
jgi:hypothetical protein